MSGQAEHYNEARRLLGFADHLGGRATADQQHAVLAAAQVHATLAHAAATERLAKAVENLPTYEGMLSVYNFGGGK